MRRLILCSRKIVSSFLSHSDHLCGPSLARPACLPLGLPVLVLGGWVGAWSGLTPHHCMDLLLVIIKFNIIFICYYIIIMLYYCSIII